MTNQLLPALRIALLLILFPLYTASSQWQKQSAFTTTFFNEVFFVDASSGWLTQFNGTIVRTTDAGGSWQTSSLPGAQGSFNRDICFLTPSTGFVSGDDGLWKSTNGGVGWTNITPVGTARNGSSSCWFISANVGVWGIGGCNDSTVMFYRTSNGGTSWDSISYSHTLDVAVGGMTYSNGTFYASGGNGKFWASTNNGASWSFTGTGSAGWQEDLVSFGTGLYIASANGSSCGSTGGGKLLRSFNGGATWSSSPFPSVVMWGNTMYSSTDGWGCGDGGRAFKTTDAGATWTEQSCGMNRADRLDDIHFTSTTSGWAVGDGIYQYVGDAFTIRPDTIDFGDILIGTTSSDSMARIKALGASFTVLSRTIAGTDPTQFGATGTLGTQSVISCQEESTALHFSPTSEGVKYARVDYALSGISGAPKVYLKGRGVKPNLIADRSLTFDTLVCIDNRLDTLRIENRGTYSLRISSVVFNGLLSGSFQIVAPALPMSIPPGGFANLIVRATASLPGPYSGTMSIVSNDVDRSPWNVQLSGFRQSVALRLNQGSPLVIPSVPIDSTSMTCVLYSNIGNGNQIIDNIVALEDDPAIALTSPTRALSLPALSDQGICFSARASDTGLHSRRFRIRTLPCNIDTVITVLFRATNPIISSRDSASVPAVVCNEPTLDTITLANTGTAQLILDKPTIEGADAASFSVLASGSWPDTISIGGSHRLVVQFTPTTDARAYAATLVVPSNDRFPGKGLWRIALHGDRLTGILTPTRKEIDLGDICVGEWSPVEQMRLLNQSTARCRVLAVAIDPSFSGGHSVSPPTSEILPGKSDSGTVSLRPVEPGAFRTYCVVNYDPCSRRDTIVFTGRGVHSSIESSPRKIDLGSIRVGGTRTGDFTITNSGNITSTITRWEFQPTLANVTVVSPTLPLTLAPGESQLGTVSIRPSDTGLIELRLLGITQGVCNDTLSTDVVAQATVDAITSSRFRVNFGPLYSCDQSMVVDSVTLTNGGNVPVEVTGIGFTSGTTSRFSLEPSPTMPYSIPPGEQLSIRVHVGAGFIGDTDDTLRVDLTQSSQPVILVPISARRETAGFAVRDSIDTEISGIAFNDLSQCFLSDDQSIRLVNTGTVNDTVRLSIIGNGYTLRSPGFLILPPGSDTVVNLHASSSTPGVSSGILRIVSEPCSRQHDIGLTSRFGSARSTVSGTDFGPVEMGKKRTMAIVISNTGELDGVIDSLWIEDPASGFAIVGSYRGQVVPAGDQIQAIAEFTPMEITDARSAIVATFLKPCPVSVIDTLTGRGVPADEKSNIVLRAGSTRGRWGTTVQVPVSLSNPDKAALKELEISLHSSPQLLHPIRASMHPSLTGWRVIGTKEDPVSGRYTVTITASDGLGILPSTDTLLLVEYDVLRGSEISTGMQLILGSVPSNISASAIDGDFILDDYCDAYGRLLRADGSIALDQNIPNPFNPETVIEFETAFPSHVTLTVFDVTGREVIRLIDDELPAGRRRVVVDARALASGMYTYRLTTGLQTLLRRMILAK